jgi:Recombination endonuclease VII
VVRVNQTPVKRKRRTKAEIELAKRKALSARKHWLKTRHHMTIEQYDAIKELQGGVCALCRRATGLSRELAVDHDHAIAKTACAHPEKESCINCWRGLLCATCNKTFAHARDDVMFFYRGIDYLREPPATLWKRFEGIPIHRQFVQPGRPEAMMPCVGCGIIRCRVGVAYCVDCQ